MNRCCLVVACIITFTSVGCKGDPEPRDPDANLVFIDLQPHANQKLTDPFHSGRAGNNLAELSTGKQQLGSTSFDIQPSIIQLGNDKIKDKPREVMGIGVNHKLKKLHILHATGASGSSNPDTTLPDGTKIGEYVIHYEDGSKVSIPIVYGENLRDWWNWDKSKPISQGQVAWTGSNKYAKRNRKEIRLYQTTWDNPHPEKKIKAIDYVADNATQCALFCVAMTGEK